MTRKGIILAGGSGTRLYPVTLAVSKQLMPVFDKPMIYYPLSVLMLAGVREILVITTPEDQSQFQRLLGDGSHLGLEISWCVQPAPDGLAQAYILAEDFLAGAPSVMVLGDNIFYGHALTHLLAAADARTDGATIFGYRVAEPERYGVVAFDADGKATSIEEKPETPKSNFAVSGLYFYDGRAPDMAKEITPSARGELEITALNQMYLDAGALSVEIMGRGFAWFDTGTHASLLGAANFVQMLQERQGVQIGCPEEIAFNQGFLNVEGLLAAADRYAKTDYGRYLKDLAKDRQD